MKMSHAALRLGALCALALSLSACVVRPGYSGGYNRPYHRPYHGPRGVYVAPRPVYVAPRPVYVAPRPVYVPPPAPAYR